MLDDAADVNVLSQAFAVKGRLRKVSVPLPCMEGFRGETGCCFGAYKVTLRLADSTNVERITEHIFYVVDLYGADLLLGRPWRRQFGVMVNSRNDQWWYSEEDELPEVRVRHARALRKDLRKATEVFAVNINMIGVPVPPEFAEFEDVVAEGNVADRTLPYGVEHAIDLEPGTKPPLRPLYDRHFFSIGVWRIYRIVL